MRFSAEVLDVRSSGGQQAKVLAFFVSDPGRTPCLGSVSLLSPFVSASCFTTIYIRLLWECLLKKKKKSKASCIFIAWAIPCRAKRVTSVFPVVSSLEK